MGADKSAVKGFVIFLGLFSVWIGNFKTEVNKQVHFPFFNPALSVRFKILEKRKSCLFSWQAGWIWPLEGWMDFIQLTQDDLFDTSGRSLQQSGPLCALLAHSCALLVYNTDVRKKKKKQSQPFPNFSTGLVNDLPEGTPIICTARRKKMTHPLINSPRAPFARHFEFQNPPRLTLGLT